MGDLTIFETIKLNDMLTIKNLKAIVKEDKLRDDEKNTSLLKKEILKGINLNVEQGEMHMIMGPNGSGKSSLAAILAGNPKYEVTEGKIIFDKENLCELEPEERARKGLFLALQYPVEIPGIKNSQFIKTALNKINESKGLPKIKAKDFLKIQEDNRKLLNLKKDLLKRHVNCGFSGGEKKYNEIFQMAMLKPKLAILDEIDSGLDIDALKDIGQGIQAIQNNDNAIVIITHYPRILQYIKPDKVHILINGQIVRSGDASLAQQIEQEGYKLVKDT